MTVDCSSCLSSSWSVLTMFACVYQIHIMYLKFQLKYLQTAERSTARRPPLIGCKRQFNGVGHLVDLLTETCPKHEKSLNENMQGVATHTHTHTHTQDQSVFWGHACVCVRKEHFLFWIKESMQLHTMEYLVALRVLRWVCSPFSGDAWTRLSVCVCECVWVWVWVWVCVWVIRPEMGWVLLSSLNYWAHGGIREWALTPAVTGAHCSSNIYIFIIYRTVSEN